MFNHLKILIFEVVSRAGKIFLTLLVHSIALKRTKKCKTHEIYSKSGSKFEIREMCYSQEKFSREFVTTSQKMKRVYRKWKENSSFENRKQHAIQSYGKSRVLFRSVRLWWVFICVTSSRSCFIWIHLFFHTKICYWRIPANHLVGLATKRIYS